MKLGFATDGPAHGSSLSRYFKSVLGHTLMFNELGAGREGGGSPNHDLVHIQSERKRKCGQAGSGRDCPREGLAVFFLP